MSRHTQFTNYKRRIRRMIVAANNMKWTDEEVARLAQRLVWASAHEGIDDVDLRVLVRIYNRELLGREAGRDVH